MIGDYVEGFMIMIMASLVVSIMLDIVFRVSDLDNQKPDVVLSLVTYTFVFLLIGQVKGLIS